MTETLTAPTVAALPERSIEGLRRTLSLPKDDHIAPVVVRSEYSPNTCVAMPLNGDPHRLNTIQTTFRSLGKQQDTSVQVVIGDNGIGLSGVEQIRASAEQHNVGVTFVDAPPVNPGKDAGYARGKALAEIVGRSEQDPDYRGPILLIDSDTAITSPTGAQQMRTSLFRKPNAVAVSGKVKLVPNLVESYDGARDTPSSSKEVRALPSLWQGQCLDIASIVAFSSTIAGKTTGLMFDPGVVKDLITNEDGFYVQMPHGSAEDMMASARLNRHGTIYQNPNVTIIDEARPSPAQTMRQQINWGRDHVLLLQGLKDLGLVDAGIQVLEPWDDKWVQWTVPGSENFYGVIINPADLYETLEMIDTSDLETKQEVLTHEQFTYGIDVLRFLTREVEVARSHVGNVITREDLPTPLDENPTNERFSPASKKGRLVGNIAGLCDILEPGTMSSDSIPDVFLFGNRQSADWV